MSPRESDWGLPDVRGGDPAPGSSPSGASAGLYGVLRNFLQSQEFAALVRQTFNLVPQNPGDIKATAAVNIPVGWLLCDGASYGISSYPQLYAAIGVTYGGDAVTTFQVPDLRGRVMVGTGLGAVGGVPLTNRVLGVGGGEETHIVTTAEMPVHTHTVTDPGHKHNLHIDFNPGALSSVHWQGNTFNAPDPNTIDTATTGITINNAGSGTAHNNMQPFRNLNFCIFAGGTR